MKAAQIAREHELPRCIRLHHVSVGLIVATDGKRAGRRAGCPGWADGADIVYDIGSGAKFAVGPHRKDSHGSAMVVGHEHILARRMNA